MAYNIVNTNFYPPGTIETVEIIPKPEGQVTTNSTRVANTTFDGASYTLSRPMTFNRLIFRCTGQSGTPTARILIYQAPYGKSGTADLKGTIASLSIPSSNNYEATMSEGIVTLDAGIFYVLYGRDSGAGSITFRTYATQATDLFTGNVENTTHPTSFTTSISTSSSPSTFNPLPTGGGGSATAVSADVVLAVRLLKV